MLSFLHEQSPGEMPGNGTGSPGHGETGVPNKGETQEYLTVAANSKNLRKSTILVGILVAIGLLCLGYMIHKSQPQSASARPNKDEEANIEAAISRLTGVSTEMVSRMDEIVNKFYEFSDVFQIGVAELAKNPFEVEALMGAAKDETVPVQDDQAKAALIRREMIKKKVANLALLSVMRSDEGNACMINDRILRQGDLIEGFVVTQIAANSVELTWKGDEAGLDVGTEDLTIQLNLAQ
jgi:preprotein translocase subunit SecG